MSGEKIIIAVALMAAVTYATRLFPFILFGGGKTPPPVVTYLGRLFPPAIICSILVYCYASAKPPYADSLLKQAAASAVVVGLHLWKSNAMLSILSGVAAYMALVQFV